MAFNAPDWLIPDWPAPTGVQAVCSTRQGGVSVAPYNSFNLGEHVGDEAAPVAANRALFQRGLGVPPVFLNQVHGTGVVHLDTKTPHGRLADAAVTDQPGVACTIMVADCLPVLLVNSSGTLVAAAHAGWRGLAGQGGLGVLEATCQCFSALTQSGESFKATEIQAWLGPCIGPRAFEVGDDVRDVFVAHDARARHMFQRYGDKWLADLAGLARQRLNTMGITRVYGNDSSGPWCTVGNPSRFFSHRRDRVSGRMAVAIWRTGT